MTSACTLNLNDTNLIMMLWKKFKLMERGQFQGGSDTLNVRNKNFALDKLSCRCLTKFQRSMI